MLLQRIHEVERPVAYVSRAFNQRERNWSTIEQEAFAVYHCIITLERYLLGHHFTVQTDHDNLRYIDSGSSPKLSRWRMRLQMFSFDVHHIKGVDNVVADALSLCFVAQTRGTISQSPERTADSSEKVRESSATTNEDCNGASIVDDDDTLRHEHIASVHGSLVGHRGVQQTVQLLRGAGVGWRSVEADVRKYIAACPTCQKIRLGRASMDAALQTTAVDTPFEVLAVDTIGPLPQDSDGNRYIVVVIDSFTRFVTTC